MALASVAGILAEARRRSVPRRRLFIGATPVGSVAVAHLPLLRDAAPDLRLEAERLVLDLPRDGRDAWFAAVNARLRDAGAILGWRDEAYPVVDPSLAERGTPLARIERAAARFWGTLTFGAHANGYVARSDGRPERMWIARRAMSKATDPGRLDNLVGGGVPFGQTPHETLLREAWEEAGLPLALARTARPVSVVELDRDTREGLQFERLHCFDLEMPAALSPLNQDGEVAAFLCPTIGEVLDRELWTGMAVDAALVTLDFLQRHGLLDGRR